MNGYNRVVLMGNLGNTPELRTSQGGKTFTSLSLATNYGSVELEGEKETHWFQVHVWGRQAENCQKYLKKGQGVLVEGYLDTYKKENAAGTMENRIGIHAHRVEFLPKP